MPARRKIAGPSKTQGLRLEASATQNRRLEASATMADRVTTEEKEARRKGRDLKFQISNLRKRAADESW
jgi:hypothetical protein